MNNPNHPLYNALGGSSNLHLLDNMLFTTDQGKQNVIQQYTYPMETLAAHQHAMNLAVSGHTVSATTIDSSALIYQQNDNHQQQPISYKIPQVGAGLILQHQHHQPQHHQQQQHHPQHQMVSSLGNITSLQDKKKDIVAQAMREEKIFEELNQRSDPLPSSQHHTIIAKKTSPLGLIAIPTNLSGSQVINAPHNHHQQLIEPIALTADHQASHSGFVHSTSKQGTPFKTSDAQLQPNSMVLSSASGSGMSARSVNLSKTKLNMSRQVPQRQQQIIPRLQLFEDEDDGLTCRMCLQPFWYRSQLFDHLKNTHSVLDPERYEREEREKKVRRQREEQQRIAIAKQQRLVATSAALRGILPNQGSSMGGRGVTIGMSRGGGSATLSKVGGGVGSRGGRGSHTSNRMQVAGPRPSFQYRDGSFICDLCKKSFSDGNDMVAHWKQHVKQQQQGPVLSGRGRGGRGRGRGSAKTHTTSRGRPITGKQAGKTARIAKRKNRKDKGKPKWTAYLLWSTRKRKELAAEQADLNFAQISRLISEGWKEVTAEENEALKIEAEELNLKPREEFDSGEEDMSDLEFDDEDENIDQIFDEFEQEQLEESRSSGMGGGKRGRKPGQKYSRLNESDDDYSLDQETTRSGRVPKRTKFFHRLNDEEDDSDSEEDLEDSLSGSEPNDEESIKQARKGLSLPLKKRGRPPTTLDSEIKRAIKAALAAKPIVVPIGGLPKKEQDESVREDEASTNNETNVSESEKQGEVLHALEGSVTEEDPPEDVFEDDSSSLAGNYEKNLICETEVPDVSEKSKSADAEGSNEGGHPREEPDSAAVIDVEEEFTPLANEVDHGSDQYKSLIDDNIF